ncbi:hypothetical protein [Daejeonella rubra]|nr:hypothetical protein [Daejeonella rubra]
MFFDVWYLLWDSGSKLAGGNTRVRRSFPAGAVVGQQGFQLIANDPAIK